jgi:Flavodoxin domain
MRGLVIYESMYGNTHQIADAIAEGMDLSGGVQVLPVIRADQSALEQVDVVVVGGPTHAHAMSRQSTRKAALDGARKPGSVLHADPDAADVGLRDWFESLGVVEASAAAFDTRTNAPLVLTGSAAKGIGKRLRRHGLNLIREPESFLVDKENRLLPGERRRAVVWGGQLARALDNQASEVDR